MKFFEYTSLHQYLDCVLKHNPNAKHIEIKEAKRQYWKLYYSHYRKEKRKTRKEFTLGFYKKQLALINHKKGTLSVSKFLYQTIDTALQSEDYFFYDVDTLSELHLHLMQLISLVEELLDANDSEMNNSILERLEQLEATFSQLLNS